MQLDRLALFALSLLVLIGCATTERVIPNDAAPDSSSGYVAGLFANNASNTGFAIIVIDVGSGNEYKLSFGNELAARQGRGAVVNMIALPPGRYRVGKWVTFHLTLMNEFARTDIPTSSPTSVSFTVAPGGVIFLGSFYAAAEYFPQTALSQAVHWRLTHSRLSQTSAEQLVHRHYPKFAQAPFSCAYCGS